jgi:hypothetical protein
MNHEQRRILFTVLNLKLPDEIRTAVATGATSKGLDVEKLLESYRAVYALGFYDGAIHVLTRGGEI